MTSVLIGTGVDCEKRVALLHVGAVLKMACDNLPAHLCLHLHGLLSLASADFVEIHMHIFCHHLSNESRSRWRLSRFHLTCRALKDPVTNKRRQDNKEQVRPFGNPVAASRDAFHSNLRALGSALLCSVWSAHRRVNVHLGPPPALRECLLLRIERRCLIWPLFVAGRCATD